MKNRLRKIGVSVWLVIEPIAVDFEVLIPQYIRCKDGTLKPIDSIGKKLISRSEFESRLRVLINNQKLSFARVAIELGVSVTTVRRVCRTHHLGIYCKRNEGKNPNRLSQSSQAPYGWNIVMGELIANFDEQKWISKMVEMCRAGESLNSIARFLSTSEVPTKNGGKWHAKTVSQILRKILSR